MPTKFTDQVGTKNGFKRLLKALKHYTIIL